MNEDYTKLKDFAQKRLDDSCKNGNDDDVRYWIGYIDGLNALHKELCKTEEALEKQIPKKPIDKIDPMFGDISVVCPNCENTAIVNPFTHSIFKRCPNCGQALDWSDNNA